MSDQAQEVNNGFLARLLREPQGKRNPLLSALGYYSSESQAIGAGNELYNQILTRAHAAITVEAEDEKEFSPRFEMLAVHVYLTLQRLRVEKGTEAETEIKLAMQCFFDRFWTDVRNRLMIKEKGLGLIESGKWVKECEKTFFGMATSFDETWGDEHALKEAIKRNITSLKGDDLRVEKFVRYMHKEKARLDGTTIEEIWTGTCWDDQYPVSSRQ